MCSIGNDLNEDITPVEAGLTWTIGKSRRDACDFLGGEVHPCTPLPHCPRPQACGTCPLLYQSGTGCLSDYIGYLCQCTVAYFVHVKKMTRWQ